MPTPQVAATSPDVESVIAEQLRASAVPTPLHHRRTHVHMPRSPPSSGASDHSRHWKVSPPNSGHVRQGLGSSGSRPFVAIDVGPPQSARARYLPHPADAHHVAP